MTKHEDTQTDENNRATHSSIGSELTRKSSRNVRPFGNRAITGWGYTYFLKRGDFIKVGHSAIPKDRIKNLQSSFPDTLEVLAIIPNTIIDEPTAHKKFEHLRVQGEWFRIEPDLLAFIEWAKAEADEIPKRTYPKPKQKRLAERPEIKQLREMTEAYEADDGLKECRGFYLRKMFNAFNAGQAYAEDRA